VESVELTIPMTPSMTSIQTALVDLIGVCLKELKAANQLLDTDELTTENALTKSFDYLVKLYVDPVQHTLSFKSRQLLADIRTLRRLLFYLIQYDSVTFYSIVHSIWQSPDHFGKNTGWMFLESADSLYSNAKQRVLGRWLP
jgi:DNA excision repair protein ERCC-4